MGPGVIVIGSGFSGTMAALQLRRALPEGVVHLFDCRSQFGRGAAYAATVSPHLLNVRSSNMSAFPDDPGHFERWLSEAGGAAEHGPFAERPLYGRYLCELLAAERSRAPGRVVLHHDQVLRLERAGAGWRAVCGGGRRLAADAVVIATGNLPSCRPTDGVVVHNPWAPDVWTGLRPEEPVLIVGTGLTMVDLVQGLRATGFGGRVIALSRRGLVPQRHEAPAAAAPAAWPCPPALLQPGLALSALLRGVRRAVREAAESGVGWRAVVDGLRPVTNTVWTGWGMAERARFLRHLRPYWDIHRHRIAPAVAARFAAMAEGGQLELRRGRVAGIVVRHGAAGPVAQVSIRRRGSACVAVTEVQRVVIATGAGSGMAEDPLLTGLLASGTARADGNGLGLAVTAGLAVLGRDGAAAAGLWALGPIVRGTFWECTAVPDIRLQAHTVAAEVARHLRGVSAGG